MGRVCPLIAASLLLATFLAGCARQEIATSGPRKKSIQVRLRLLNEVWTPPPYDHRNDGHWPTWWFGYDRLLDNNILHELQYPKLEQFLRSLGVEADPLAVWWGKGVSGG